MRAADLELLHSVSRPSAMPDGSAVVVAVSHPSLDADAQVGQLWSVPLKERFEAMLDWFRSRV